MLIYDFRSWRCGPDGTTIIMSQCCGRSLVFELKGDRFGSGSTTMKMRFYLKSLKRTEKVVQMQLAKLYFRLMTLMSKEDVDKNAILTTLETVEEKRLQ